MALESADSQSVPVALGDLVEEVPDSGSLRVSDNTQFESGIPPAREQAASAGTPAMAVEPRLDSGIERLEAALSNVVRTDANLGLLVRGLKHLSSSAQRARAANDELMRELDELRTHLTRSQEEEQALRFRMSQLEQRLALVCHESSREREFLIEQQDLFLVELMTDHDRQLVELRNRLQDAQQNKFDAQKLQELTTQRDQAREYATRCERERDLAWQELATLGLPAERVQRSPSGAAAIGAIHLRSVAVPGSGPTPDALRSSERTVTGYSLSGDDISE